MYQQLQVQRLEQQLDDCPVCGRSLTAGDLTDGSAVCVQAAKYRGDLPVYCCAGKCEGQFRARNAVDTMMIGFLCWTRDRKEHSLSASNFTDALEMAHNLGAFRMIWCGETFRTFGGEWVSLPNKTSGDKNATR